MLFMYLLKIVLGNMVDIWWLIVSFVIKVVVVLGVENEKLGINWVLLI